MGAFLSCSSLGRKWEHETPSGIGWGWGQIQLGSGRDKITPNWDGVGAATDPQQWGCHSLLSALIFYVKLISEQFKGSTSVNDAIDNNTSMH